MAERGGKFDAIWDGTCAECGEGFEPGDVVGYVDGLVCCEQCWLYADDDGQPAPAVEDLLAPAPAKRSRAKKTKTREPRKATPPAAPLADSRPARELVGTAITERMEQRKMTTQEELSPEAALFVAAGLTTEGSVAAVVPADPQPDLAPLQVEPAAVGDYCCKPDSGDCCGPGSWCCARAGKHTHDEEPATQCQLAGDCDGCEPTKCPATLAGRNAFAARVEPDLPGMLLEARREASLIEPTWPPAEDPRLAAIDLLEQVPQPETVHAIVDDSMADLVEQPAQTAAAYESGPLNQQQWLEQAHTLQQAGQAPQPEYFVDGRRVNRQEWQDRQAMLQDGILEQQAAAARAKFLAEQEQPAVVHATPQQLAAGVPAFQLEAPAVQLTTSPPAAGDYYVCSAGHVTAQRPCEQCAAALEQEQHAAMALPSQCDTQGLTEEDLAKLVDTEWALDAAAPYGGPLDRAGAERELEHLLGILNHAIEEHPRSQQKRIGPSELGTPCDHCLAAKLAEWDEVGRGGAWLPTIGTAVHSWIEQQLIEHMRAGLDSGRYLAEHKVVTGLVGNQLIPGSCDVLDVVAGMTVDWKVVGATTLKAARGGPSATYRAQQHLYAKGWRDMGAQVDWVAIAYLPRNGTSLAQRVLWLDPYDESIAQAALDRAGKMRAMLEQVEQVGGVAQRDAFISMLPRLRDKAGRIDCHDCRRYPDYPAGEVTLDASAGGLLDV